MTDKEELSRGEALARVAVLEAEVAELRFIASKAVNQVIAMAKEAADGVLATTLAPVERVEQAGRQSEPVAVWDDLTKLARATSNQPIPHGAPLYTSPQPAPTSAPSRDVIRATLMAHGFTVKTGHDDLKPYVYEAVEALFARPAPAAQDVAGLVEALQLFVRWVDMEQSENVTAGVFDRLKAFRNAESKARAVLAAHQSGGAK